MVWTGCRRVFLNVNDLIFLHKLLAHGADFLLQFPDTPLFPVGTTDLTHLHPCSQVRRVSMQIPKSLGSRHCSVTIRTAPTLNTSSHRNGGVPFFFCFCYIFRPLFDFSVRQFGRGGIRFAAEPSVPKGRKFAKHNEKRYYDPRYGRSCPRRKGRGFYRRSK